ncbi:hypothetical protein Tsubulata_037521 [Turnera subulata]|uniref:Uncharacterized protein n=1 Tax=Turnera subulata TaxID=218843 RepID=A0A9Q0JKR6_9ROSI|nr:hypothetical protein Tsubulata_037521 [Turnera subulata]
MLLASDSMQGYSRSVHRFGGRILVRISSNLKPKQVNVLYISHSADVDTSSVTGVEQSIKTKQQPASVHCGLTATSFVAIDLEGASLQY